MRLHADFDMQFSRLQWANACAKFENSVRRFETLRRKAGFNPDQPRDELGRWTDRGGAGEQPTVEPAFFDPRRIVIQKAIEAGLAFYTWLSARNGPDEQAIVSFNAREFRRGDAGGLDLADVRLLDRDSVDEACPRFGEVQERTNLAADTVTRLGGYATPAEYGTAVHTNLKRQVDSLGDPDFIAERSLLKSADADVRYGTAGSIRVDVLENVGSGTVCVYDIKTGERGLSMPRTIEIASRVAANYRETLRIIVTEVRPRE